MYGIPQNPLLHYDLTEIIESMMNYVDFIDENYQDKPNNNIMKYWQAKGVTLKSIILTDLLDWLCCLAFSDGFIAHEEVQFINKYLKQNFSEEDLIELCQFRINETYFNNLPLSFILFYENDLVMKSQNKELNTVESLYMLFMVIGVQFIYCDDDVVFKELSMLNTYLGDLSKRICDFDLIQNYLSVIEISDGESVDDFSENRYPFNQDIFNNYREELAKLKNFEEVSEEISQSNPSSSSNVYSSDIKQEDFKINYEYSGDDKTKTSWNLEKNLNDYYNFTGEFDNHFVDFNDIFTQENREKLENTFLTPQQYRSILNKIKSTSDNLLFKIINENYLDFNSLTIFEKILLFTNSFVNVDYKATGENLGDYSFNHVNVDKRENIAIQTITLIHELAHHLLAEIFEQAVMILLNTDKTDSIEAYVGSSLGCNYHYVLLNEYCAHTVEGSFIPQEYQHYGSFLNVLDNNFDKTMIVSDLIISRSMKIGNTFSQDILAIINPFIDNNNLREEIMQQFENVEPFNDFQDNPFETNETLKIEDLLKFINEVLLTGFDEFYNI